MTKNEWKPDAIREDLEALDGWRASAFEGHRRAALALARTIEEEMCSLSPRDLVSLAESRDCHTPLPEPEEIERALREDYEAGEAACQDLAQRIVDTALFGRDLLSIELHRLVELAYAHEIEHGRMIGDWRDHEELITASRRRLRHREVFRASLQVDDLEAFPKRIGGGGGGR